MPEMWGIFKMTVNLAPEKFNLTTPSKHFKCSRCEKDKACVVKLKGDILCIQCRYNDIGKDALYEALYNGLD